MADFDDKQRIGELGTGMLVTIGLLLLLGVLSIVQLYFTLQMTRDMASIDDPAISSMISTYKVLGVFQVIFVVVSALTLFFTNSRWSVFGTIAVMIYVTRGPLLHVFKLVTTFRILEFPLLSILDLAFFGWIVGYLLLSPNVDQIYHTGTRRLLTRGLANTWRRIRGRPTIDEIEAASLNRTFN